jgi:hypothetical protein
MLPVLPAERIAHPTAGDCCAAEFSPIYDRCGLSATKAVKATVRCMAASLRKRTCANPPRYVCFVPKADMAAGDRNEIFRPPWRDMTRPALDEMYYDAMKERPPRNPPSARARVRGDWFVSADADCNECLRNTTSGKCQKTAATSRRSRDHTATRPSERWPVS